MTTPVHTTKGWPTELQVLLLRACLLEGAEADMAYTAWRPQVELEHLDPNSNFLLSLLQTKGADKKETSEAMALMLKGTYRYVRTRNSALLGSATAPMKAFQEAGIDVMLLNGMATARHYYNDLGARRMHDIDILVPTGRAVDAMRILRDNGWAPGIDRPERSVGVRNGCHFYNKLGLALDLHWHALLASSSARVSCGIAPSG